MIPDAYLNSKYSNCKTPFSFSFLFSENTDSKTIPNRPLVSNKSMLSFVVSCPLYNGIKSS